MTIKYKDRTYNAVDNFDGTFTLTPVAAPVNASAEELVKAYRQVKAQAQALLAHRDQIVVKLQALAARRDELKALIQTSGVDPDADLNPAE